MPWCRPGNGAEGLAKARGGGIDMVLTDLNMPVMNGIDDDPRTAPAAAMHRYADRLPHHRIGRCA